MIQTNHALERCQAFIDSNFVNPQPKTKRVPRSVTISRQAFSKSHAIAEELMLLLQKDPTFGRDSWALFDRDLVHKVLEDHNLPRTLARFMPEDRDRNVTGLINEILGLHPSQWELFHHTCDTILRLARVGNVILIGRGAHIITRQIPHVLHVRIVSPMDDRVERARSQLDLSHPEAVKRIKQDDSAREAFVRSHFDEHLDMPMAYHLTLNSGRMSVTTAAEVLYTALKER